MEHAWVQARSSKLMTKHSFYLHVLTQNKKHKPKEYPQQPETKTVAKQAMSEVCLLPRPSYSRGHMQGAFPHAFAILWPIFPKLVRRVFPKELLSASLFTSSTKHTSSTSLMSFISPTSSIPSSTPSSLDLHLHLHHHHHHHHLHLSHLHYLHHLHIFPSTSSM